MQYLEKLSTTKILDIMNREDFRTVKAVKSAIPKISKAVTLVMQTIQSKKRVFLAGAGTSGRLCVIEQAEMKPTFGFSPFNAIIAGGNKALFNAKENMEDSKSLAVKMLKKKNISSNDLLIGITASGTTPFTISAINYAKSRRARTILITTTKNIKSNAHLLITVNVGNEVISSSTRLKAGTATKMILNMLSACSMIKLGHTYKNLMIGVTGNSKKLKQRKVKILTKTAKCSAQQAAKLLLESEGNLKTALVMKKLKIDKNSANSLLRRVNNNIHKVIK